MDHENNFLRTTYAAALRVKVIAGNCHNPNKDPLRHTRLGGRPGGIASSHVPRDKVVPPRRKR